MAASDWDCLGFPRIAGSNLPPLRRVDVDEERGRTILPGGGQGELIQLYLVNGEKANTNCRRGPLI